MNYQELFGRLLIQMVVTSASVLVILVLMAISADQELKALEATLAQRGTSIQGERISVKESFQRYIDSLPMPEPLVIEEAEEVEVVEESRRLTSEEEVILLAKLMHAEEGVLREQVSCEDAKRAHMLCGSVVLNRRNRHHLGDTTIEEVVYAPGQYDCIKNLNQPVPEETVEWARELIEKGPIGPSNMIYQAEFEQGSETYDHIGNQYFCCE